MVSLAGIGQWLKDRKIILLLSLIVALGIFLRFYQLGTESIWLDEAHSINLSTQGMTQILEQTGPSNHPPLYFILLHFWINLFGTSEVAVRSLSAIFGIISILLIYQVGTALFNRRVGLISSFLSAISYYHIFYSQEARGYSLFLLLSLLSYLFFIKIIKQDKKWHYPCYFLTNVLLGYTHFYSLFIIASQVLFFLLFWNKYRPQRVKFLSTLGAVVIALLPSIYLLFGQGVFLAQHGFWIPEPELKSIWNAFAKFAGTGPNKYIILWTFLLLAITGFFSIKLVASQWRRRKPPDKAKGLNWSISLGGSIRVEPIAEGLLLIIWLFVPIIIPFVESKFMTPIYLTRYMIGASPALYILVAKGMGNLNRKWLLYPVLIFITLLSSLGLYQYYKNDVKEQWREVASFVEDNSKGNDVVIICAKYCQVPFDYYYRGNLPEFGIGNTVKETQELATFVDNAVQGKDRLWLILSHAGKEAPIRDYLVNRYGNGSIIEEKFVGIQVYLFNLSPP